MCETEKKSPKNLHEVHFFFLSKIPDSTIFFLFFAIKWNFVLHGAFLYIEKKNEKELMWTLQCLCKNKSIIKTLVWISHLLRARPATNISWRVADQTEPVGLTITTHHWWPKYRMATTSTVRSTSWGLSSSNAAFFMTTSNSPILETI